MKTNNKFYETRWFCILLLFLFAPAGIFLLWKYKHFSTTVNAVLSAVFSIFFIFLLVSPQQNNTIDDESIIDTVDTNINNITTSVKELPTASPNEKMETPKPKPKTNSKTSTETTPTTSIEYDALQQLYLDINPKMSYKKMMKLVKSTKLPYSVEKSNGSRQIQVAFTDGNTRQKYKKDNGDYLEIIYVYPNTENSSNDILEKYSFGTCVYIPSDSSLELINHVSGYYFSYYEPGNYISDLGNTLDLDKAMSKKEQLDYYLKNK